MIKTIPDIELANISRYRGELMGLAMLFIVLFHVALPRSDAFYGLRRMGNIGVDMFLFLSGVGLWFSWTRHPNVRRFFRRRLWRVYPAWFVVACAYYIPDYALHGYHSSSIIDLIGDITINWDFWLRAELTFWYIPATMMLYLFAPAYMELIHTRTMGATHTCCRWPFGDFLEPHSHLLHRYQPGQSGHGGTEVGWNLHMDDHPQLCHDLGNQYIP